MRNEEEKVEFNYDTGILWVLIVNVPDSEIEETSTVFLLKEFILKITFLTRAQRERERESEKGVELLGFSMVKVWIS